MNALKRFILALRGIRAPHVQDDDDRRWPWWDDEEDPSLGVIRREARLRAHSDLMESIDKRPSKKLTIITTSDIGNKTPKGQK